MVVSSGREIIGSECECLWRKTWDVRLGTRGCSPREKKNLRQRIISSRPEIAPRLCDRGGNWPMKNTGEKGGARS